MNESVKSPIAATCVNCHRQLGIGAGVVPHFIHDGGQETKNGEGKLEAWCPVCFVMKRAHQDVMHHGGPRYAAHWHPKNLVEGTMKAIKCGKCGVESLSHGPSGCLHCGETRLVKHMAEPHYAVVLAGAKDPTAAVAADPYAAAVAAGQMKDDGPPSSKRPSK